GWGPQPLEGDGEQPGPGVALLFQIGFLAAGPTRSAAGELLDQQRDVQNGDVSTEASGAMGSAHDRPQPGHAPQRGAPHLMRHLDLSPQWRQRPRAHLDAGLDVTAQAGPRVAGPKRLVGRLDRLLHRQHAQPLQQFGLTPVPAVQRAHADPGAIGYGRDRGTPSPPPANIAGSGEARQALTPGLSPAPPP